MRPGVRRDLVARVVRVLERLRLRVDAVVQGARDEEGGLCACGCELLEESGLVLVWPVVEGESHDAWSAAGGDHAALARLDGGCGGQREKKREECRTHSWVTWWKPFMGLTSGLSF